MTKGRRRVGLALCLATILLAVLDSNIVSAATIPIVRDLDPVHGVDRIPWLISGFQLAATAALPLYGRLSDVFGAKKIFVAAVGTFLFGSALCGLAQTMGELIAARSLQGVGGGGLMSITMVVLHQMGDPEETPGAAADGGPRGGGSRGAGIGGIVAGGGMALGPWIGGLLSDHVGWRWIFYVNLPVGLAVVVAAVIVLRLPTHTTRGPIDFLGAGLAAAFCTALLLVLEWGGTSYAWSSPTLLGLMAGAAITLALFLRRQATTAEPVLPLSLFKVAALRTGFAMQGLVGVAMVGTIIYVMIYLQVVRGIGSSAAGLHLLPMAAGMTASGLLSGRLGTAAWTRKHFLVCGTVVSTVALALLATTGPDTGLWQIRAALLLMGIGFGQLVGKLVQLAQETAPRGQLGVATTGIRLFQTLGAAGGTAVFGSVLSRVYAADGPGGSTSAVAKLTGADRAQAINAFVHGVDIVFLCTAGVMAITVVLALRLPGRGATGAGVEAGTATTPLR
ncbi:MFS transporter [Streptomyces tsukubensis]|uniref:MFS transporter n=1 Tax=Streptomyces tsukubensis TaxID=83656 RepID=A0A1V4A578_9ACTN|nr:MFS transporter [Streptomyces tsukubensis]OON75615.1 MFS transporter [Streptomyces tsukubensis]QFR94402.1 MFS transporter [Streptomyces tsukubensis]